MACCCRRAWDARFNAGDVQADVVEAAVGSWERVKEALAVLCLDALLERPHKGCGRHGARRKVRVSTGVAACTALPTALPRPHVRGAKTGGGSTAHTVRPGEPNQRHEVLEAEAVPPEALAVDHLGDAPVPVHLRGGCALPLFGRRRTRRRERGVCTAGPSMPRPAVRLRAPSRCGAGARVRASATVGALVLGRGRVGVGGARLRASLVCAAAAGRGRRVGRGARLRASPLCALVLGRGASAFPVSCAVVLRGAGGGGGRARLCRGARVRRLPLSAAAALRCGCCCPRLRLRLGRPPRRLLLPIGRVFFGERLGDGRGCRGGAPGHVVCVWVCGLKPEGKGKRSEPERGEGWECVCVCVCVCAARSRMCVCVCV